MIDDKDIKTQLSQALGSFVGQGHNCICNAHVKNDCVCGADWSTKKELLLLRKLEVATNALIEATTDIDKFGSETNLDFQELHGFPGLLEKYDKIADELEDLSDPLEELL